MLPTLKRSVVLMIKVEAPIRRLDPFPHSMKPPKVNNVITQKWVAWTLFTAHSRNLFRQLLLVDTIRCIYDTELMVYNILLWNYRKYSISYKKFKKRKVLCFFSILLSLCIFGQWKSDLLIWAIAYLDAYRWFSQCNNACTYCNLCKIWNSMMNSL
jgi:hypothetical protein